ncbi:unnamed protein product [Symbiodinium pilosum]|uniref:Reverse transcriptase domain-containing protein n=1 Tax=Symbiodinium pilosum TaxID=2952 RepID=A0A812LYA8_SYMPI|nr:unnamed protein product [Symbiodinium pilosum]
MWDLRAELRLNDTKRSYNKGISLKEVLQGWLQAARLQQVTREVRKAGRLRKLQKIEQVLRSTNIYRAAKTLAPKAPRRRMQIRDKNGRIQTAHADFEQILQYFQQLYSGPQADSIVLDTPLLFTTDDVQQAVHRLSVSKVMPAASAPAALWRLLERPAATKLTQQFNQDFSGGPIVIPDLWNVSELVLLPKPFKPLKSPADLRPIALLPPEIKVLSTILAERIRPYALQYLADIPQLAYLAGRSLQQAPSTFMDEELDKAYDRLPRVDLEASLNAAGVPTELVKVKSRQNVEYIKVPVSSGLAEANSTYADDFLFNWAIDSLQAADKAYQEVRSVLQTLHSRGLQVSGDKTVILLELRGKHSNKALKKYIVKTHRGRSLAIQQARQITKSYSVITRESNDDFMERYAIPDVVELIAAAFVRFSEKPAADFEQLPELDRCRQWRSILSANFLDIAPGALGARTGPDGVNILPPVKLVPVDLVAEQFLCDECGFALQHKLP